MFLLAKIVGFLTSPSNVIGLLGILGLAALLIRWRRLGTTLLAVSVLLVLIAGLSPLGLFALAALEDRFPQPRLDKPVAGIIMLGGAVDTHITGTRGQPALNEGAERVTTTAALARRFPAARILLSGGGNHVLTDQSLTESAVARDVLVGLGVEAARIEMEERSRDTCENAEFSRQAAAPKDGDTWLLVTSASHMPRAMACFRAADFEVTPYPVDYRTRVPQYSYRLADTVANGLEASDLATHEWLGLLGYWLTGRTTELVPEAKGRP